jgi:hypothetical protein
LQNSVEVTWVICDYAGGVGGSGSSKESSFLRVLKGQQVEVVEWGDPMCLVRLVGGDPTNTTPTTNPSEGLVPLSVLKQVPPPPPSSGGGRLNNSSSSDNNTLINNTTTTTTNNGKQA